MRERPTHCPQGHPYTIENTYINPKGIRSCRTCNVRRKERDRTKVRYSPREVIPAEKRFMELVLQFEDPGGIVFPRDQYLLRSQKGCWIWLGVKYEGYGQFSLGYSHTVAAHRFSYEMHVGPIPEGLTIDHLCREKDCVSPFHLEVVTREENLRRAIESRRMIRGVTS